MNEGQAALIAEQIGRALDSLRAELRLAAGRIQALEEQSKDYEARLRALNESATQFKMLAGLATGGGLLSLVALLRELVK